MKLYIYDHCPFCVKARMIFGLRLSPSNCTRWQMMMNVARVAPPSRVADYRDNMAKQTQVTLLRSMAN